MHIDGRLMSVEALREHLRGLDTSGIERVCVHNTYQPDEAQWRRWGGWGYWKNQLKAFYEGKTPPWTVGPHTFVSYEGVGLFTPLDKRGRAVGGGSLEIGTRHVEIVGWFEHRLPEGETLNVAVGCCAAILEAAGLTTANLTNHSLMVGGWPCPGAKLKGQWGWFKNLAAERLEGFKPVPEEIGAWRAMKVPYNPNAALSKAIEARDQLPSAEWYTGEGVAQQWGLDRRNRMWHLWRWTPDEGARVIFSEPVDE